MSVNKGVTRARSNFRGRYKKYQSGPYRSRRKTSQVIVQMSNQNADSRYQVSDFCDEIRVETNDREDERSESRLLYDSDNPERSFVEFSNSLH